jgi:hypothetical protein
MGNNSEHNEALIFIVCSFDYTPIVLASRHFDLISTNGE